MIQPILANDELLSDIRNCLPQTDGFHVFQVDGAYRVERDETNTWGVHLGYERPVGAAGWHLGGILTFHHNPHNWLGAGGPQQQPGVVVP